MPRFFSENFTNPTRAQQIWPILIAAAAERRIVTYRMVAHLIGYKVSVALGGALFCQFAPVTGSPQLLVTMAENSDAKVMIAFNIQALIIEL